MLRRKEIMMLLLAVAAFAQFVGCSAENRKNWYSVFLDVPDTPPPPTRRVRRDLLREIEDLKHQVEEAQREVKAAKKTRAAKGTKTGALPIEQAKNWQEAAALLPKGKAGSVDWPQALKTGAIAPRPSPDPAAPEQAALELDVELASSGNKTTNVTFSHGAHTQWLTCSNCHPSIFPLRPAKPAAITMAKIRAGQFCGACHGRVAFGVNTECSRCHVQPTAVAKWQPPEPRKPIEKAKSWEEAAKALPVTDGMVDWVKALSQAAIAPRAGVDPKAADQPVLPLDVELVPAAGDMFKVIFPHKTHTEWLGCPNCHTAIFQMAKGADPITMEKINAGQYCGVCHGKVAFPATACARCHPVLAGGK